MKIGTEFVIGQGFGNQLFSYISTRCIAMDLKADFFCINSNLIKKNLGTENLKLFNLDFGLEIKNAGDFKLYKETSKKCYIPNSIHDLTNGCDVSCYDEKIYKINQNTVINGNLQDEKYFIHHKNEIKEWLKIPLDLEISDYSNSNTCIINFRGGEYVNNKELYLKKRYWFNAIKNMKKVNANMKFVVITDDVTNAKKYFKDIPVFDFGLAKDFVIIKNAYYAILSNSSFAYFPIFLSETIRFVIAPKYWARHNVSNGYWSTEQNIYIGWNYQDKKGNLFSSSDCKIELRSKKIKINYFKFIYYSFVMIKNNLFGGRK